MRIRLALISSFLIANVYAEVKPVALTDAAGTANNKTIFWNINDPNFNKVFNSEGRSYWMARTYLSYAVQKQYSPVSQGVMTQSINDGDWFAFYFQPRLAYIGGDGTANAGIGYRRILEGDNYLWGLNTFFDEEMHYNQVRLGLGGELFTRYVNFRANLYETRSSDTNVGSNPTTGAIAYERPLPGFDFSVEVPVPYVSWIKFMAQGYRFRGDQTNGANGGGGTFRIFPARQVEFDVGFTADSQDGVLPFIKLDFYLASPDFVENSATTPSYSGVFAPQDLHKMLFEKAIRHDDIVVEKTSSDPQIKRSVSVGL